MRRLFPPTGGEEVSALAALGELPRLDGRPAVRVCMVQSLDGVIAIDGTSAALSGPADRAFYLACRSLADTVLVGAQTVRAEGYGPARLTPELIGARSRRGQPPLPRIAVVSRSLDLDPAIPFFTAAGERPYVITCAAAPADRRNALAGVAEVIVTGDADVDLEAALGALATDGAHLVVAEGGPTLNGALLEAGLVDELCLSVAPMIAGDGPRLAVGARRPPAAMELHRAFVDRGHLFLLMRPTHGQPPPLAPG